MAAGYQPSPGTAPSINFSRGLLSPASSGTKRQSVSRAGNNLADLNASLRQQSKGSHGRANHFSGSFRTRGEAVQTPKARQGSHVFPSEDRLPTPGSGSVSGRMDALMASLVTMGSNPTPVPPTGSPPVAVPTQRPRGATVERPPSRQSEAFPHDGMGEVVPRRRAFDTAAPAPAPAPGRGRSTTGSASRPLSARSAAFMRGGGKATPTAAPAPALATGARRIAFSATAEEDGFTVAPITYNIPILVTNSSKVRRAHSAIIRADAPSVRRPARRGTSARAAGAPAPPSAAPAAMAQLLAVDAEMLQWEASLAPAPPAAGSPGGEDDRVPPVSPVLGQARPVMAAPDFVVPATATGSPGGGASPAGAGLSPMSAAWEMALQSGAERWAHAPAGAQAGGHHSALAPPAPEAGRGASWGSFMTASEGEEERVDATPTPVRRREVGPSRAGRPPIRRATSGTVKGKGGAGVRGARRRVVSALPATYRQPTGSKLEEDFLTLFAPVAEAEGEGGDVSPTHGPSDGVESMDGLELSGVIEDNSGGVLQGIDTSWGGAGQGSPAPDDDGVVEVVYDAAGEAQLGDKLTGKKPRRSRKSKSKGAGR